MKRDITNFALTLVFRDWGIWTALIAALGIGGSIVGHVGPAKWPLSNTLFLICISILFVVSAKSISFAFKEFIKSSRRLKATKMLTGEGFNKGQIIFIFEYAEGFSVGQLITLCCASSGAIHPLIVLEISAIAENEIQAVCISTSQERSVRKYYEEESRLKMLYATSSIMTRYIAASNIGGNNEQ